MIPTCFLEIPASCSANTPGSPCAACSKVSCGSDVYVSDIRTYSMRVAL